MDDTVDGRVLGEDLVDGLLVGEVDLVEVGATAADQLNAVEGDLGGVVEVVDNDDIVVVLEESEGGEGANVAGSTGGRGWVSRWDAMGRGGQLMREQCDSNCSTRDGEGTQQHTR